MTKRTIANLDLLEKPGRPGGPCIVLFHGYGADASDLYSLSSMIKAPQGTSWLFPNGILKVGVGPHNSGRAWFPIDIAAIEKARLEGKHRDLSKETPPGLKKIKEQVFGVLAELKIPLENVILGGFSQGAMLATYLALNSPVQPKGLIILSGALLDEKTWIEKARARKGLKFYQCHGEQDEVLSVEGAKKLNTVLLAAGLIGELEIFDGGHEIPQEIIYNVNGYLKNI